MDKLLGKQIKSYQLVRYEKIYKTDINVDININITNHKGVIKNGRMKQ